MISTRPKLSIIIINSQGIVIILVNLFGSFTCDLENLLLLLIIDLIDKVNDVVNFIWWFSMKVLNIDGAVSTFNFVVVEWINFTLLLDLCFLYSTEILRDWYW